MDQKLLFRINDQWTHPALDWLMATLSSFAVWGPILLILALGLLLMGGFKARAFVLCAALAVGVCDGLVSSPLKKLVNRPRPHQALDGVRQVDLAKASPRILALAKPASVKLSSASKEPVEGRSFPSSHTMNTLAAALVALCFYGARALPGLVLALGVAYSRIYTGSHWPSDVLISLLLAAGTTALVLALLEELWRRFGPRLAPQLHSRHPSLLDA